MVARRIVLPAGPTRSFVTRADHEAAMADAEQIGQQPGILVDELLPPLPHTADVLAAFAALLPPNQWAELPLERIDPRAPWRDIATASVWSLPGLGSVWITGSGPGKGWGALLRTYKAHRTADHLLVHSRSGHPVRFGNRYDAMEGLEPVMHAHGAPPTGWAWNPPLDLQDAIWTPLPATRRARGMAAIWWQGRSGRWVVQVWPDYVTVTVNRRPIVDSVGDRRQFSDATTAKAFCIRTDGQ